MKRRLLILLVLSLLVISTQALGQWDSLDDEEGLAMDSQEVSFVEKMFSLCQQDPEVKKVWFRTIPFSFLVVIILAVLESLFVQPKKDTVATFYSKDLIPSGVQGHGHEVKDLHKGKHHLPQGWYLVFVPQIVAIMWMLYRITLTDFVRNTAAAITIEVSKDAFNAKEVSIFMFFVCFIVAYFISTMHENKDGPSD